MKSKRIACIAMYVQDSVLVRTSIVINKIKNRITENLFFHEDWIKEEDFQSEEKLARYLDKITTEYVEKAVQYKAEIRMIDKPVALEKCACGGCDGYLTNEICADDLEIMEEPYSRLLH
jgi:hypothetical protein